MKLVFGIGNPGPEYAATRHNVGFLVVRALAGRQPLEPLAGLAAEGCTIELGGELARLVRPLTYVNRCGPVLAGLVEAEGLRLADCLVLVDDLWLALGRLRLRGRGSDGGHNGLASLHAALASEDYPRLRIGIGGPGGKPTPEFVLEPFSETERPTVEAAVERAAGAVRLWARVGLEQAMSKTNRADLDQPPDRA